MGVLKLSRRVAAWGVVAGMFGGLGACNTVSGFGQDMSEAGHALKKAAE